jgi:thymidylate kinase
VSEFTQALRALDDAAVPYRVRKPPEARELDLWLSPSDLDAATRCLRPAGFFPFNARGQDAHRFFLSFDQDDATWRKLDVKLEGTGRPGVLGRVGPAVARRVPVAGRRLGPVVAILGPDGAGKGTVIRGLHQRCPVAVTEVYLGRKPRRPVDGPSGREAPSLASKFLPQSALLLWKAARDWRKLMLAYRKAWRGHIVLCDRHPIEVLAVRPERSKVAQRLERLIARHLIPWPDLILVLDAPPEQLLRRKREHPVETLERWRRGYAEEFGPRGAVFISTAGPREESLRHASRAVWGSLRARRGW